WGSFMVETYLKLHNNVSQESLEVQFSGIAEKYIPENIMSQRNTSFHLQSLKDVYLNRKNIPGLAAAGSMSYIFILSGIALVIALIACINFMNLSIVNSSGRGKEIGMRKTLGAARGQIVKQFMTEAFLYSLVALMVGIIFARIFLSTFSHLLDKEIELNVIFQPISLLSIFGILLLFTLLSGGYPSFFLSRFNLNEIQKTGIRVGRKSIVLRKFLVIFQFSLSLIFVISTVAMRSQLELLKTRDLGFDKENVVALSYPSEKNSEMLDVFKTEFLNNPNIMSVSGSGSFPGSGSYMEAFIELKAGEVERVKTIFETVDEMYVPTLHLEISEGRNFSREFSTDMEEAVLVNKKFVQDSGLKSPLGIELGTPFRKFPKGIIIGVIEDFHIDSLLNEIEPVVFIMNPFFDYGHILVRIKSEQIQEGLAYLKNRWNKLVPEQPFEYKFLDSEFEKHYHLEKRWGKIALFSSILAIFIACLGMFGLIGLITVQRTKEIGIRKVLGASISNIITLLTKEFTILILASNVIAWPVAYLILRKWLQDYPYRITLGIGLFLVASILTIIIALLTTTFQATRAAVADPVDTLKYE
ncbi:MAG: FtsX-like permease family protein, partial [Candidatus Aminicenantes bacterium]|nr:FtsX-like permease family protein [Candidatus Aminicenantes bacterium]